VTPPRRLNYRTAIGRAYYAVFLIARERMRLGVETLHGDVIRLLRVQHRAQGDQLAQLFRWRTSADYSLVMLARIFVIGRRRGKKHERLQSGCCRS